MSDDHSHAWTRRDFICTGPATAGAIALGACARLETPDASESLASAAEFGDGDAWVEAGIRYLSNKGTRRRTRKAATYFAAALQSGNISEAGRDNARQLLWGSK